VFFHRQVKVLERAVKKYLPIILPQISSGFLYHLPHQAKKSFCSFSNNPYLIYVIKIPGTSSSRLLSQIIVVPHSRFRSAAKASSSGVSPVTLLLPARFKEEATF
jgi:hypothetical protein